MLHFIFGDAGAGKSAYIIHTLTESTLRHPHQRYYLFVPEQNTLKAQQAIIRESPVHGMLHLDVLSFQLLSYRVMEELGIEPPVLLDEVSKSILLRKTILEEAPQLKVYRKHPEKQGLILQLKKLISEFGQYNIRPEALRAAEERAASPLLKGKLHDVRRIYEAFLKRLSPNVTIPEEMPQILMQLIHRSGLLKGAVLYFDGFTGFTPVQLQLLGDMLQQAKEVYVAVTIPPAAHPYRREFGPAAAADRWWLSRETIAGVCTAAEKNRIRRGEDICLPARPAKTKVQISACLDRVEEVRLLCSRIQEEALYHQTRYRRMAVAVTDPAGYQEILLRQMDAAGIPRFLDERADSLGSPAVELIRAAFGMITGSYAQREVLRYLRNPLILKTPGERDAADRLDNLLRKKGIRGRKSLHALLQEVLQDPQIPLPDAAKTAACAQSDAPSYESLMLSLETVFSLHDALKEGHTVREKTGALKAYLDRMELPVRTAELAGHLMDTGFPREAAEAGRITEQIPQLLDRLEAVLGTETAGMKEYASLLESGFLELKAGMIPETLDMLVIGDLKRSRFDDIDVLYILGANDGLLPSNVTGGGLFTDRERMEMQSLSLEMAPDDRTDSCIQLFYLYMFMRKPVKKLVLSYAMEGPDGHALKPSFVVEELLGGRYSGLPKAEMLHEDQIGWISGEEALTSFSMELQKTDPDPQKTAALYLALAGYPGTTVAVQAALSGAGFEHTPDALDAGTACELYHGRLEGSVTRIERFEGCPYSHFLRYGLRLSRRQEFDIEAVDIGNLYHKALDYAFRTLAGEGKKLGDLKDGELTVLSRAAVKAASAGYHDDILEASERNRAVRARVQKMTDRTLFTLQDQMRRGQFDVGGTEVPFSYEDGALRLRGVIDRVDLSMAEDRVYVKVIDYKSGAVRFDLSMAMEGLQLQLTVYMDMALRRAAAEKAGLEAVPAGMFYYHMNDPVLDYVPESAEERKERRLRELRLSGVCAENADAAARLDTALGESGKEKLDARDLRPSGVLQSAGTCLLSNEAFEALMERSRERMRQDARRILAGEIDRHPYAGSGYRQCERCDYAEVCGFHEHLPGFSLRRIQKHAKEELLSEES